MLEVSIHDQEKSECNHSLSTCIFNSDCEMQPASKKSHISSVMCLKVGAGLVSKPVPCSHVTPRHMISKLSW